MMLHDPGRHEPLQCVAWDEERARATIGRIVRATEARVSDRMDWPIHPLDADNGPAKPLYPLYFGACGVIWALRYLEALGAVRLERDYREAADALLLPNRTWLASFGSTDFASYLMGDTGLLLLSFWLDAKDATAARLAEFIATNVGNPARELMWGAPGTMLAALFLHRRCGGMQWAAHFRASAERLRSQLLWSSRHGCHYWTQDMYGQCSSYLDAVHGFAATASVLIHGRDLLETGQWDAWERTIVNTIARTAIREGALANWPAWLDSAPGAAPPTLMQFCHGAPGFVICLADLPSASLDDLLVAGGEATWVAGPLRKGSNLCHGTGGNGYAFLKLYQRTGDIRWLDRARAFAMHGIAQTEAHEKRYGQLRYSLWTGDPGFAIYLWDCIRAQAAFPTLDVFFA